MTSELVIREATLEDLPAVVSLLTADAIREVDEGDPTAPEYVKAFEEIDTDPRTLLLVGDVDGSVVATAQLTFLRHLTYHGGLIAQVESVRTVDHLRGRGIGRRLMEWIISESRRRGAVRLQLTTNNQRVDAHRFYDRLGFVRSHLGMKLYLAAAKMSDSLGGEA